MAISRADGDRRRGSYGLSQTQPPRVGGTLKWLALGLLAWNGCRPDPKNQHTASERSASPPVRADTVDGSVVPPDSTIPAGAAGASIRRGRALLESTRDSLPDFVGANLRCMSCHLDDGRRLKTGPLIGVYARYPRFIDRAGGVASIEDRVNFCFTRSLAGRKLPTASRDMRDIVNYLAFLSTGIPKGSHIRGEGITPLPRLASDTSRGALLFGPNCSRCHGYQGQGTIIGRTVIVPALWGAQSFSIAAGMAREARTAAFIQRTMPNDKPGTLTDQEAFDLAAYILSKPRPDLPGKASDWPNGDAPYDVPYATKGHAAYRGAALIPRTGDTTEMLVPISTTPGGGPSVQGSQPAVSGRGVGRG